MGKFRRNYENYKRKSLIKRGSRHFTLFNKSRKHLYLLILCAVMGIIIIITSIIVINKKNAADKHSDVFAEDVAATQSPEEIEKQQRQAIVAQADRLAMGYDYDQAIAVIDSYQDADTFSELAEAKQRYLTAKGSLVEQDIMQIPHVFFHSLIADTSKAFDGDREMDGYNQYMTTIDEFNKIIQQMYDRGFVLVSMHDMAYKVQNPDGSFSFQKGSIMLPPGKKAFVLSVDDVNYYGYMKDDGFASRIVLDENGRPTNEMEVEDGKTVRGAYDIVPLLDQFIEKHPDFSYQGAKGILALTGYEGVMGYRTCPTDEDNGYQESDIAKAKEVAAGLKADGWEFASHSWGHQHLGQISFETFKTDTDRWEAEVEPIIGPTDIIIYPFGEDIAGFRKYEESNQKFQYLKQVGFDYFCNVDGNQAWVQLGSNYLRQGRRNLDGYRMYYDMIDDNIDKLSDLFNVNEVFDAARPTPIKPLTGDGK